jgi:uncharacterized damage-inducible protein DinB
MPADLEHFARLLRYGALANAETVSSLRRVTGSTQSLRWMGHIAAAELLWLARLTGEPPPLDVWPDLDLEACAARIAQAGNAWPRYLAGLAVHDLEDGIGYRNSKGEFWTSTIADILTHVVTHSAYHRGQIAAAVRAAGGEPAYTDFIHAARQGLVE